MTLIHKFELCTSQVYNFFGQHFLFKVDILINNAGRSQRGLITETALEVDRQVFEIDLLAPISITKAILPYMIQEGQGHVVCTSSVAGKLGAPGSGSYSAAKHGIQVELKLVGFSFLADMLMTLQTSCIKAVLLWAIT